MTIDEWKLTKDQYDKLLYYVGCGNFPGADILIFGNEEGTGRYSIESNVEARFTTFGKLRDEYEYCFEKSNWKSGYWEPSSIGGRNKIIEYLRSKGESPPIVEDVGSPFLRTVARISLALENPEKDASYWFQRYSHNKEARDQIKEYILDGIFCPRVGIQTALTDWRHLPRPNEKNWPLEYFEIEKKGQAYLNAYGLKEGYHVDQFSDYGIDVTARAHLLKDVFEKTPAKLLIGLGGADGFKKDIIEHIYPEIKFKPMQFEEVSNTPTSFEATLILPNKKMQIFLLPFPDHSFVYKGMDRLLAYQHEFTTRYLMPAYMN